ncbi:hypothetical protein BFP70_04430 [Thioclava sp. SK-1]|uniref:tetratricopeptide repeat protein n=1 Tax=Thioclava sp. SK-1 TaxID=1889770 RepID=UPI000826AE2B|nr:tetratricopeptide repeat protein [Thioclava sp. SK-1]OCX66483.1 hypothetical protein BFP70_04430 [Thioclava sp. SK-1]
MSETDSFIDEVTEEVRRDRLYAAYKKYGWIGAVVVVAIVGGAAYTEWSRTQSDAQSQAFGDALMAAVEGDAPAEQLADIEATGARAALRDLMAGSQALQSGERETGLTLLRSVSDQADVPRSISDLAQLKWVIAAGEDLSAQDRDAALVTLSAPGAPYAQLAQEQQALALMQSGDTNGAIALAQDILGQSGVTAGLQQRLSELIVALGGDPAERG